MRFSWRECNAWGVLMQRPQFVDRNLARFYTDMYQRFIDAYRLCKFCLQSLEYKSENNRSLKNENNSEDFVWYRSDSIAFAISRRREYYAAFHNEEKNSSAAYLKILLDLRWMCKITSNFNIHELWVFESSLDKSKWIYTKKQMREEEGWQKLAEFHCYKENIKYLYTNELWRIIRIKNTIR